MSGNSSPKTEEIEDSISPGEIQTLKLLPVQLITSELPPQILEFSPDEEDPTKFSIRKSISQEEPIEEIEEENISKIEDTINENKGIYLEEPEDKDDHSEEHNDEIPEDISEEALNIEENVSSNPPSISLLSHLSNVLHIRDIGAIEEDALHLLLNLLNKVIPCSSKKNLSKSHQFGEKLELVEPNKVKNICEYEEVNKALDDEEELRIEEEEHEEEDQSNIVETEHIQENEHVNEESSEPLKKLHEISSHDSDDTDNDEALKKLLPNLLQAVLEESSSLKPEESEQLTNETVSFVSKLLEKSKTPTSSSEKSPVRENTFIVKPKTTPDCEEGTDFIHSKKETLELVNNLLDKTLEEEKLEPVKLNKHHDQNIDQVKKDTLVLVHDLLNKVDKLTKTIECKIDSNRSSPISNEENIEEHKKTDEQESNLPVIESILEVSEKPSPEGPPQVLDQELPKLEEPLKSEENLNTEHSSTESIQQIDVPVIEDKVKLKGKSLSRAGSIDLPQTNIKKLGRQFGSHEILNVPPSRRPSFLTKNGKLSAVNRSFIRPEPPSSNPSRSGSISESSGISTPKRTGVTKRVNHKRSEIVAAVTQRLYNKRKEKQDEEKISHDAKMFNARIRLQDITQRALRANKRRAHVETQTEDPSTIRMKEKSTDVQDIAKVNLEVKDVFVEALTKMETIGVNCQIQNTNQSLKLTGTSSTQTDEPKQNQTVSFTKYLQNPPLRLQPYSQPIYTSSVNINVQHNYPQSKDEHSDDSLDESGLQTVQFSTPDLISNHNSLEQVNLPQKPQVCVTTQTEKKSILHADINKEKFVLNECFATKKSEYCVAESSFILPSVKQTLTDISIPVIRAPSCCMNEFTECCKPLRVKCHKPELAHPITSFEGCQHVKSTKTSLNCPRNKSPLRQFEEQLSTDEEFEEDSCSSNHKRVRFAPPKRDILEVVTDFLDEASTLLYKLNTVAKQVESNKYPKYIFPKVRLCRNRKDSYAQTYRSINDASSQTQDQDPSYLEQSILDSCQRLKECVAEVKVKEKPDEDSDSDYLNVQSTDWKYCPTQDYSSLDTIRSTSDYGSMSRQKYSRKNQYSPKAYMQQLLNMRKKIVEDTRNDILADEYLRLPSPEMY